MTPEQRYEMYLDWLAQVRARVERFPDHVPPVMRRAEALRLLACADALAELVALHPDPRQRSDYEEARLAWRREYAVAWERARRGLAGEGEA